MKRGNHNSENKLNKENKDHVYINEDSDNSLSLFSEAGWQATFNSIKDSICIVNLDGKILKSNYATSALFDLDEDKIIGNHCYRIVHNTNEHFPDCPLVRLKKSKQHETMIFKKDDQWLEVSVDPVFDDDKKLIAAVHIVSDITERKNSEELVHSKEKRFRDLLNNLNAGVVVHAADTSIIYNNLRACELLGLSEDQMKGKQAYDPAWKFVYKNGDPIPLTDFPVNKIISAKEPIKNMVVGVIRPVSNDIVWLLVNGFPEFNEVGEIIEVIINFIDITDSKTAEEKLEEYKNFLDKIIETSALSTWISDENGTAVRCNPACLKFFGAKEEEVIGKYNLLKDKVIDEQGFMPDIRNVFEKGEVANIIIDYDFCAVDHIEVEGAKHKLINSIFTPLFDKDGKVSNVIIQSIDLSEVINAEKEIDKARNRSQQYLDIVNVMMIFVDADGLVNLINPKGCEILGYSSEEILGKNWFDSFLPEDIREIVKDVAKKVTNGEIESVRYFENYILTKDGRKRLIAWNNSEFRDEQGKIIGTLSSGEDITDQRQTLLTLKESEAKFRSLVTNSEEIVYLIDKDGIFLLSEGKGLSKIGVKPGEVVGKSVFELYKDYPEMLVYMRQALKGETINIENKVGDQYFKSWYTPQINADDEIIGLLGLSVNITENKKDALSILRLSQIFEKTQNDIFIFNSDTFNFIQLNNAAQINLGYSKEEIKKMTPLDIKPLMTKELFTNLLAPLRSGNKEKIVFETVHQRKDKTYYNVEVHLQLLNFEEESSFVAIILDITSRKKNEDELAKHRENLEVLVKDRTIELENKNKELDNALKVFVGREMTIRELQKKVLELGGQL